MIRTRPLLEFARHNAIALLALLIACSGTAYAAIPNGSVTTVKIKNGAVTAPKLKKEAVKTAKIKKGAVTSNRLKAGAVNRSKLKEGSVDRSRLADDLRVISSGWHSGTARPDMSWDGTLWTAVQIAAPELTAELMDTHAVHVYFRFLGRTAPLPYTTRAGGKPNTMTFVFGPTFRGSW